MTSGHDRLRRRGRDRRPRVAILRRSARRSRRLRDHGGRVRPRRSPIGAAVEASTRFGLASGTKLFTALTVMSLIESGHLQFDLPVRGPLGTDLPLSMTTSRSSSCCRTAPVSGTTSTSRSLTTLRTSSCRCRRNGCGRPSSTCRSSTAMRRSPLQVRSSPTTTAAMSYSHSSRSEQRGGRSTCSCASGSATQLGSRRPDSCALTSSRSQQRWATSR